MTPPLELPTEEISVVEIDPITAEVWLEKYNQHNRGMRTAAVNRYARDMSAGRWMFNGEAIQFDADPKLQNGQHRLAAVVKSQTTQKFLVVTGLPPRAQDSMDAGVRRTPGDVLALAGYGEHARQLAAVARLCMQMEQAVGQETVRLTRGHTTGEIHDRIERDPMLQHVVTTIVPELAVPSSLTSKTVVAYCFYRFAQISPQQASEFFRSLVTLANLPADSPILALHRRLTAHTATPRKSGDHVLEAVAYVTMAWNAWRRGEGRTMLKLPLTHGDRRLRIPQPK